MSEPTVRLICPNLKCRRVLAVPVSARGKMVICKECGTHVKVPAQAAPPPGKPQVTE